MHIGFIVQKQVGTSHVVHTPGEQVLEFGERIGYIIRQHRDVDVLAVSIIPFNSKA